MRNYYIKIVLASLALLSGCNNTNNISLTSPDKELKLILVPYGLNELPGITLETGRKKEILRTGIELDFSQKPDISELRVVRYEKKAISNTWINNFGERSEVPDNYNQVKLFLESNAIKVNLVLRAYNEGVAFAYEFPVQEGFDSLTIKDERIHYSFKADHYAWSAPRAQALYTHVPLSKIDVGCERPLVIEVDSSHVIALAEAKLVDYARMKFEPESGSGISIRSRLGGEVKKALPFQSPWRVIMVGKNPGDLLEKNYLLLNLNDPSEIQDASWIKPGKVLREVTLTTTGAKAAIDFTSSHNMQYVEFDAGWYGPENNDASDARAVNLDPSRSKGPLDMKEVISYANSKNIGILLYVNRRALERQLDELLPIYKEWGIAGIKFGFVQVGTQEVTKWLHESIKKVASYNMVADVHDEYRPTGFSRTYPNFLTMEGIRGDEESPANNHTLITMFTRMLAGQGDNTICYYNERVDNKMGSHASQLAKAVCIFSPLQFLYWYDKAAPDPEKNDGLRASANYIGSEPELEFFNSIPTVWDETKVLHAKIGEFGVIARRKGEEWFIGGINGDKERTLMINFSFLDSGIRYRASVYSDDLSINTRTHVRTDNIEIDRNTLYPSSLGRNKGIVFHITPVK